MLVNKADDREWKTTDYPGIERSLFRTNETGGRSSVVRLVQGSRFPRHAHDNLEQKGKQGKPSRGYIAWLLWGGDEGRAWSEGLVKKLEDQGAS